MRQRKNILWILLTFFFSVGLLYSAGERGDMGIGFRTGFNRLEGDLKSPSLKPFVYGTMHYNLTDFLAFGVDGGYSSIGDNDNTNFKTILLPYEGHLIFNFFPISRVNIYATIGGGGVYWNATMNDSTIRDPVTGKLQKGIDSFLKTGGGVEFAINKSKNLFFSLGATFRYSLTDMLDQRYSGDENDGVTDFYAGLTYTFRTSTRGDKDNDGIPDELDLAPEQKEDEDGYMDHDGKPDGVPHLANVTDRTEELSDSKDTTPPVVIHAPVRKVEEYQDIKIKADIFENKKLKVASILYRPIGFGHWSVVKLKNKGGILYEGTIPGKYVRKDGLEYCVIAVDDAISGVGYCGLPKRPVRVKVIGNPKLWRFLNGTAALMGWGTASYIILRKQKNN